MTSAISGRNRGGSFWEKAVRPVKGFASRRVGKDILIIPFQDRPGDIKELYCVHGSPAVMIWELIESRTKLARIRDSISEKFKIGTRQAGDDLRDLVEDLLTSGVIELV